jgi:hypothetical protein
MRRHKWPHKSNKFRRYEDMQEKKLMSRVDSDLTNGTPCRENHYSNGTTDKNYNKKSYLPTDPKMLATLTSRPFDTGFMSIKRP